MSVIFNVGNRIMNTYVYNTSAGYIMADAVLFRHGYFANVWRLYPLRD